MSTRQVTTWHNWSDSVRGTPLQIARPRSLDELIQLVKTSASEGRRLRVVGSGHSFTPLVQVADLLVSLENLQGIEKIDYERLTATILAGTTLKNLGKALFKAGVAQENLGDIDAQSIAGAISTGTHGTGINFGTLSTQVVALTLVTASGELLECSSDKNPEIFKAAQVSLGLLGIIVKVELRVVLAKVLTFRSQRKLLSDCLANLESYRSESSHFEFYYFPYTKWVQAKFLNETEAAPDNASLWNSFNRIVMENGVYWVLSEISRLIPRLASSISKISALGVANVEETDYSHHLFATPRYVKFQEMEYNISRDELPAVLAEIQACLEKHRFAVHFPIECRFVKGDDIWLSPAYGRDSAYVAVHMYKGMPYKPYFRHIEAIFQRHQGRPHWGKIHTRTAEDLAALYPHWHDFRRLRASLDPCGMFLNSYLQELFDTNGAVPVESTAKTEAESIKEQAADTQKKEV